MENNVAVIDPDLCIDCGECVEICPQNCILQMPAKEKIPS
jgi:NAD-dependent dihydropyrimidine dehydrogenase PreA subunit